MTSPYFPKIEMPKPCPCCGAEVDAKCIEDPTRIYAVPGETDPYEVYIRCSCGVGVTIKRYERNQALFEIVAIWNRRAA